MIAFICAFEPIFELRLEYGLHLLRNAKVNFVYLVRLFVYL